MGNRRKNNVMPEKPVTEDSLQLSTYITGISDFICECPTPMTISIQGDWGAGKTTIFNLISNNINNRGRAKSDQKDWDWAKIENFVEAQCPVIPINTWQFAVAGYKDNLTVVLISLIYNRIKEAIAKATPQEKIAQEEKRRFEKEQNEFKEKVGKFLRTFTVVGTQLFLGDASADAVNEATKQDEILDVTYVQKMRDTMQNGIRALCEIVGKDRIIIFIDDLDRLEPRNAVELLEGVKNFIDCEKCVFVLAIDQKVVFQGVKEKYGDEMGAALGNKFFDKIIQVPFTLPVVSYDVKEYIKKLRPLEAEDEELIDRYNKIVSKLTDKNPRGMKRLFSMFLLYEKFEKLQDEQNLQKQNLQKEILFAILAFQLNDEKIFSQLLVGVGEIEKENITQQDIQDIKELLQKEEYQKLGEVLELLYGKNTDEVEDENILIEDEIYKQLIRLLKGTVGATNGVEDDIPVGVSKHFRRFEALLLSNRDVIRKVEKHGAKKRYYYYKGQEENGKYVMISIHEKHLNINLYGQGIPGIREKIEANQEYIAVENPDDVKDGKNLYYMKKNTNDTSDSICIVRVDNRVEYKKLENLYYDYVRQ